MQIKVKYIKQSLLIVACVFFAGLNYFNYVKADDSADRNVCDRNIDSDCDGLTNVEEKLYETNPENSDSDNDSYSDGVEVKSGYDPLKPAPGDKIILPRSGDSAASSEDGASNISNGSFSESFSEKVSGLISSKEGSYMTIDDIKSLADLEVEKRMGEPITFENLPEADSSQIKILQQDYFSLSAEKRKEKELEDAKKYLEQMIYLFISNSPEAIESPEDLKELANDVSLRLDDFSQTGESLEYFSDLGNRLELFLANAENMEVPETMLEMHMKFVRIMKGFLSLREYPFDENDSMERMLIISRARQYNDLLLDFIKNDFEGYFFQFK